MRINDYSQAGQTTFVHALCPPDFPRHYLDIGCAGLEISNTLGLEEIGWNGTLVDNSVEAMNASARRRARKILADATTLDYSFLDPLTDYLSLDIDQWSIDALRRIPLDSKVFRVITIEHDQWRFGDELRRPMREILQAAGYDLLCPDVCNPDPFEDWWVMPPLVDMSIAEKFRRNQPTHWKEVVGE